MKSIEEIAQMIVNGLPADTTRQVRYVTSVLRNEIPAESCPEKKGKVAWKREKVVEALPEAVRTSVGPEVLK